MDKSWIDIVDRTSQTYMDGVERFLDFAYANNGTNTRIYCPCRICWNRYLLVRTEVKEHLVINGFLRHYKSWTEHGETYVYARHRGVDTDRNDSIVDNMIGMVYEAVGNPDVNVSQENDNRDGSGPNEETTSFLKILQDAEQELYPGCRKFTALSFIVRMLNLKVICGWSNKSFTLLLELLKEAFPSGTKLPKSYYEANKLTTDLGFTYKTWDACPNNCMLFKNEDENLEKCLVCQESRWKNMNTGSSISQDTKKRVAAKRIRYFPLKPRLKRLFMSSKTASLMKWHAEERSNDGVLRHPADSQAWKMFDVQNPCFASDIRNVRLGLAADGFNPFRTMSIAHSTWPIVLCCYNLPPWLCMKQPFLILSVLIDGPKGPGDKIDVYMQPLIDELKELWSDGVPTYDASSNEMFKLHAALLWTISDFPAYANLSGWSTKGKFACPCCNLKTRSHWMKYSKKFCFIGNRRFLHIRHRFRRDRSAFYDLCWEWGSPPPRLSGNDVLCQLNEYGICTVYRKEDLKSQTQQVIGDCSRKRKNVELGGESENVRVHNWKKKSIFFELPYWKHNLVRHNLDVMHIEKNFCDNLLYTLLGTRKSKDNLSARRDLKKMQIRFPLHPQPKEPNKCYLPPACFSMTREEINTFLSVLKEVRAPDGYASNISRCVHVKERSIWGLKSHDNHILLQQFIPLAARRVLPKKVVEVIIELSIFFRQIWSKVNKPCDLQVAQDRITTALCLLEKIFPPTFFDIMEHLPVHLAEEAQLAGNVQFRSMYPIERFLLTLKQYVRNRAHPEGSIAKGYLIEECMNFCSRYLDDVETKSNRPIRNHDSGNSSGRPFGKEERVLLDNITWVQAHRYVLVNTEAVTPYMNKHLEILRREMPRTSDHNIRKVHNETFHNWFRDQVNELRSTGPPTLSEEIEMLARGPDQYARKFNGYIVNGFRFRIKDIDNRRSTQNSGVCLKVDTVSYSSSKDRNPRSGDVIYYGVLTDILELIYTNNMKFVLFKCDWVDNRNGMKQDEFKFNLVNFNHLMYKHNQVGDEPFILATQAEQAFYVRDPLDSEWQVAIKMTTRDLFDNILDIEPYRQQPLGEDNELGWVRPGIDGNTVDGHANETDEDTNDDA